MEPRKSIVSPFVHQAAVSCMVFGKFEKWSPNKHSAKKVKKGKSLSIVHTRSGRVCSVGKGSQAGDDEKGEGRGEGEEGRGEGVSMLEFWHELLLAQ